MAAEQQHQSDADTQENGIKQKRPELLVLQDGERTPTQGEEQQREVAARQQHEDGNHHLGVVGKGSDVGRTGGEASRADGGQRMTEGVIEAHIAPIEQKGLQQGEEQINEPYTPHGVHHSGVQLVVSDTVDFRDKELHSAHAEIRKNGQRKHDDSQTAYPLGHAAPKENVFGNGLYFGKYGGACGGEARQGFKEAVREIGNALAQQIRHRAKEGEDEPGNADDIDAIARSGLVVFVVAGGDEQDEAGQQGDKGREGHTEGVQPAVEIGHGKHRQHEKPLDEEELTFNAED